MSGHRGTHDSEHHCKLSGSTKRAKTYGTCTYNCSTLGKRLLRMSLTQRAPNSLGRARRGQVHIETLQQVQHLILSSCFEWQEGVCSMDHA